MLKSVASIPCFTRKSLKSSFETKLGLWAYYFVTLKTPVQNAGQYPGSPPSVVYYFRALERISLFNMTSSTAAVGPLHHLYTRRTGLYCGHVILNLLYIPY